VTVRPAVIVLDVNETLSDMSPMAARFAEVGVSGALARVWFATLLRDGFALTAAGDRGTFADMAAEVLRGLLDGEDLNRPLGHAVEHVMAGMAALGLHEDVADGVRELHQAGRRLITLTNGSSMVAKKIFGAAGILDVFEALLSVDDAPAWKPAPDSYLYAARVTGVDPSEMMMVAVHPWDIHGAAAAGLRTAWINRSGARYPAYFTPPEHNVTALTDLPDVLAHSA